MLTVLALVAAACSARTNTTETPIESTDREDVPSALDDPFNSSFPDPLVPPEDIRAQVPPDAIPAIDDPKFLEIDEVGSLEDREPVVAVVVGDVAKAYPLQILTWHEIVNDTLGDIPLSVTYCPLCNSALAFDRRVDDRILDFGTSGMLYNSALVMYDRQTESLWSHFTGQAIVGTLTGTQLETVAISIVSFADFKEAHPAGRVLSTDTGDLRDYGRNPYVGYDDPEDSPFLFTGPSDDRLPQLARVVGIRIGDEAVAIDVDRLRDEGVIHTEVAGKSIVVWLKPGTASALDASSIAAGKDVGAVGVFERDLDGRQLRFERSGDEFRDTETQTQWNVFGEGLRGRFAGNELTPVRHLSTFWFSWFAFFPETELVR